MTSVFRMAPNSLHVLIVEAVLFHASSQNSFESFGYDDNDEIQIFLLSEFVLSQEMCFCAGVYSQVVFVVQKRWKNIYQQIQILLHIHQELRASLNIFTDSDSGIR